MKKILALIAAGALLLAAAGCGGTENKPGETTTSGTGKTVKDVIYSAPQEEDTSEEALAYLKERIPLFVRYMETRRQIPLTYETAVTSEGARVKAGIYIRDEKTIALSSEDEDGNETRVIYMDGKIYEISHADRAVYYMDYSEKRAAELVEAYRIKLKLSEVEECSYVDDFEELDGVMYQHEIIYDKEDNSSNYYYDEATGDLRFIRIGEEISEVLTLKNEVSDSEFELPADYEMIDYEAYAAEQSEST